mmetsp:Transcript_12724/g.29577  ORF Transcript_12724/g.29577 Transcript_12724/m.29577 type:complete len:164 (+) Transcript_12724:531-1022(+)
MLVMVIPMQYVFPFIQAQATRFGVFQMIPPEQRNTPLKAAAAGAFAGGTSVLLFQGVDVVKSRMQGLEAHKYRNTIHCIRELIKNEGIMAFYKGVGPRMTRVCMEVGITMSLYGEIVKVVRVFPENGRLLCYSDKTSLTPFLLLLPFPVGATARSRESNRNAM